MKSLLTLVTILFTTVFSLAQQKELYDNAQQKKLTSLSQELDTKYNTNYQKALKIAQSKGWAVETDLGNGRIMRLKGLDETGQPSYLMTESNANASATTRTNQLYMGGSLGLSLNGSSDAVKNRLGIWDGGGVASTHVEMVGRVTQQDNVSASSSHPTHVAGTMIAAGISTQARGMAFGANLKSWDFTNDDAEMSVAAKDLSISNHSYGFPAGWVFNSNTGRWAWYGVLSVSATEDYKFGFYDGNAQSYDRIAYAAPFYLIVKSAGNSRGDNGPGEGRYYFLGTSTTDSSNVARKASNGYDILSTTSNAKNILTVGAVAGTNGNPPAQASDVRISSFSSWGPTDDGRIKPDLVAVGVSLFSTSNASTTAYAVQSGTSMSSPQTSGSLLLLQEAYSKQNGGQLMLSSTLKGLALHTAFDAGNAGPDYIYGWGLLDMEKAAKVILNTDKTHSLTERTLQTGATYTQRVTASGKGALTATICWTDPEGDVLPVTPDNLNSRSPRLVNDLDIRVSDGTNNYLPFILNPDRPADVATRGDNIRDNIEQILIPDAVPGRSYTITVSNKGTLKNNTPQDYALIISGIGGTAYCASTPTIVQDNINTLTLGRKTTNFTVSSGQTLALELGFKNANAKTTSVFIDWNGDGVFDENTEKIITANAKIGATFTESFKAPTGLQAGNGTLMRVVTVEDASAVAIKSCGIFDKGTTRDYAIQFVRPEVDLSVSNLVSPDAVAFCAGATRSVTISLKNVGSVAQQNIPVTVKVLDKTTVIATLTGTYKDILAPFAEANLTLDGTFNAVAGVNYTFEINLNLASDQDPTNNLKTISRSITTTPSPVSAQVAICEGTTTLNVKSAETNPVLWYDAPTDGNLLFTGNSGSFVRPANTTKLFAGVNDFSGTIGYKTKYELGGGTYSENFGPEPIIVTQNPLVIESARVYVGTAGKITFSISRVSDLTPISSVTLTVAASRTSANLTRNTGNQLIEDPTDQGIVLPLNLVIPAAGTYKLTQSCTEGATIYRSNLNAGSTTTGQEIKGHPFTIPNVMSITGALFQGNIIKTGYYYTYDMKIKSLGCPSARVEVPITTQAAPRASITPTGDRISICEGTPTDLTANAGTNYAYQWLKDGVAITGANAATYRVNQSGVYSVLVSDNGLCNATSSAVTASVLLPISAPISFNGSVLSITSGTNPTWFVDGTLIAGANSITLSPTKSGTYTVKSTDVNGCLATSFGYTLTITAIEEEISTETSAKIFPNPATDKFRVEYRTPERPKSIQAEIINLLGMTITSKNLSRQANGVYSADFDVSKQNQGKFFVRITTDNEVKVVPLVVGGN
ncbi:MAG: S8 family serine peptidase [Arcicella sp.]|nr:S8 family serine peptidase [Arcicella sp.]